MAVFSGNGAAGTPSFTFSSDTNLGIFRADEDILSVSTGGTERARFDAAGAFELGGTLGTTPRVKLDPSGQILTERSSGSNFYSALRTGTDPSAILIGAFTAAAAIQGGPDIDINTVDADGTNAVRRGTNPG